MGYRVVLKEGVEDDLRTLSRAQQILVGKQFKKLSTSPQLGDKLGNKNGYDLSGCQKLYVDKKRIRIVYRVVDEEIIVEVIAIGKRDDMEVYQKASVRKEKL
jgi:mRNA interferase RelE/StbE